MRTVMPDAPRGVEVPETPETPETLELLDFAAVYTAAYPATLLRAMRQLGVAAQQDTGLAEEIAQEVWLRVWRHWHGELERQPARVVYAWALRATETAAIDRQRRWTTIARHGQVRMTPEVWDMALTSVADPAPLGQPEAQVMWRELVRELRVVAATLPGALEHTRGRYTAIFEALLADEAQVVTARRLGLTPGQMKMSKWRLCTQLRAHLTGEDVTNDDTDDEDDANDGEEAQAV